MREPVLDPRWWKGRIESCGGDLQRAQYDGNADAFSVCHRRHMDALRNSVNPEDFVLDAGCGYGRFLTLVHESWTGRYVGIDSCPEFVQIAKVLYPTRTFLICDLRDMPPHWGDQFDVAVCIWLKTMLMDNGLDSEWDRIYAELRRVAKRVVAID